MKERPMFFKYITDRKGITIVIRFGGFRVVFLVSWHPLRYYAKSSISDLGTGTERKR